MARFTGAVTPYRFWLKATAGGLREWRVTYGASGFLVAEGSSWSLPEGRRIFRDIEARYWKRKPVNRPVRKAS